MLVSGCSFLTVERRRPPADPRKLDPCTASKTPPNVDLVLAGAGIVAGVVAIGVYCNSSADACNGQGGGFIALPFFAASEVAVGSAVYGYVATASCRRWTAASARCAAGDRRACLEVTPGWVPPPDLREVAPP